MSWEGYCQCLCSNGHYFITIPLPMEVTEEEENCPFCSQPAVFTNTVDDTNGDSYGEIDFKTLLLKEAVPIVCPTCQHETEGTPAVYRVPSKEEVPKLRCQRTISNDGKSLGELVPLYLEID